MMICIGGVCIPLNLLVPFLIGLAHRNGWLKWVKEEWFTPSFWRRQFARWQNRKEPQSASHPSKEEKTETRNLHRQKDEVKELNDKFPGEGRLEEKRKSDSKDKRAQKEK